MSIAAVVGSQIDQAGVCDPTSSLLEKSQNHLVPYDVKEGTLTRKSRRLGFRVENQAELVKIWMQTKKAQFTIRISPHLSSENSAFYGDLALAADHETMSSAKNNTIRIRTDVVCGPNGIGDDITTSCVFQASVKMQLIDGQKLVVNVDIEPRAQLVNALPIQISVLNRLGHAFSSSTLSSPEAKENVHHLEPGGKMEVFCGGDALPVKVRCSEMPAKGTVTSITRNWIQIPLSSRLETPLLCLFPFESDGSQSSEAPGSEFFIAEANNNLPAFFLERINDDGRTGEVREEAKTESPVGPPAYLITVGNYAVDHTKSVLFEQLVSKSKGLFKKTSSPHKSYPFSSFADSKRSISLLPTSEIPIRLVQEGATNPRKSALFRIEEVSMSEGGAQATPLLWDDGSESGYFCYRKLVSSFQSELHVIPEFLLFNGSKKLTVVVKQKSGPDIKIQPSKTAPVFAVKRDHGIRLSFHYGDIGGATKELRLDELGLHIGVVKTEQGKSLGSVAVQTSIGDALSRLVIKLGEVGEVENRKPETTMGFLPKSFINDNLRFRVQAEEFAVTLNEAIVENADGDGVGTLEHASKKGSPQKPKMAKEAHTGGISNSVLQRTEVAVCTILLKHAVYDIQKLFKEQEERKDEQDSTAKERCQMSLIVNDFKIKDETPKSRFPVVLDYNGTNKFLDVCFRTKGPMYAPTVKVDLFDVILAHSSKSEKEGHQIFFQTSEDFVWKLIDTAEVIRRASDEMLDASDKGYLDKAFAAHVPSFSKAVDVQLTPPQVAQIFDISKAKVSPFNLVVSFRRTPQAERYEKFVNSKGANLMRYFTQQLKFTIHDCSLHFARYEEKGLKGPQDRLIEILTAVYISRLKLKAVQILSAASFADWKSLSSREGGDDEFVDGDLLRVTGSLAGNSVAFAFNKVGRGMGKGVSMGFEAIGGGIENGAALLGAQDFGSAVNKTIAGVGGGIGGTLQGVGEGTGSLFQGAGKGIGHFFGGIAGGGSTMAKGIGKGITTGDGGAVLSGFTEGVGHIGKGVKSSVTALGSGVGGGVTSVATGGVSGVKYSVVKASKRGSSSTTASGLAKLREEFKNQDYN